MRLVARRLAMLFGRMGMRLGWTRSRTRLDRAGLRLRMGSDRLRMRLRRPDTWLRVRFRPNRRLRMGHGRMALGTRAVFRRMGYLAPRTAFAPPGQRRRRLAMGRRGWRRMALEALAFREERPVMVVPPPIKIGRAHV